MSAAALPSARDTAARNVLGAVFVVLLWHLGAMALEGSYMLAGPLAVAAYLSEHHALIGRALSVTLQNAAWGFLAGNLAAVGLALIVVLVPQLRVLVTAVALVIFCLPLVATGPVLRILYGPGPGPQITLAALSVYYTTFIPLVVGLRAAPASWFDLVRLYGRGAWSAFVHIRMMAALPYLMAGLQIAAPAAFLGAMVGEFTGADRGMGVLALRATRGLNVEATWTIALVAALVAMLAYGALGAFAARISPDRPEFLMAILPAKGEVAAYAPLLRSIALVIGTAIVIVALWWVLMDAFALSRFFAKRPDDIWHYLVTAQNAPAHRATLWTATQATMAQVVPGYLAGLGLGAALAMVLSLLPGLAGAVLPVAVALRSIPIVTTAPLIVLALGRGATGTITIVAVMTFFPALVACIQGLRQAPGQALDVMRLYAAHPMVTLWHVKLPAMLPAFFAAARLSVPAAILAVTVAEWLATGGGLGAMMAMTASTSDYNLLWSAIVVVAAGASLGYGLITLLERVVLARFAPEQLNP